MDGSQSCRDRPSKQSCESRRFDMGHRPYLRHAGTPLDNRCGGIVDLSRPTSIGGDQQCATYCRRLLAQRTLGMHSWNSAKSGRQQLGNGADSFSRFRYRLCFYAAPPRWPMNVDLTATAIRDGVHALAPPSGRGRSAWRTRPFRPPFVGLCDRRTVNNAQTLCSRRLQAATSRLARLAVRTIHHD